MRGWWGLAAGLLAVGDPRDRTSSGAGSGFAVMALVRTVGVRGFTG